MVNGTNSGSNTATFSSSTLANGDVVSCVMTSNATCAAPADATSNSITMNVIPVVRPSVSISTSSNNICAGTPVTFTAIPANEGSAPVYQWQVNGNNSGINSVTFSSSSLANSDVVSCVMTSNAACATPANATSNSITMAVSPQVNPSVSIAASANNICQGTPVTFTATPTSGGNTPDYQWMLNGNNAGTNGATFSSATLANGDVVSCSMTSNAGCATPVSATSNSIAMNVHPLPVVNAGGNKTISEGTSVLLNATAPGNIADITWSPLSGLSNIKILNPVASPSSTTTYTLIVQTTDGCIGIDSATVVVLTNLTIPNTFTPNGDGINDLWDIKNLKDYPAALVEIFDRYGQLVYQSLGYYKPWDGTLNGKRLPSGTYYYIIKLNSESKPLSGYVVILR
jgi:gliding motility-associated-like protein